MKDKLITLALWILLLPGMVRMSIMTGVVMNIKDATQHSNIMPVAVVSIGIWGIIVFTISMWMLTT